MGRLFLGAAMAAVFGVVNLAGNGPALAAGGNSAKPPSPPGLQQTPPGQSGKADGDPEQPSPPGQQPTPPGQSAKPGGDPGKSSAPGEQPPPPGQSAKGAEGPTPGSRDDDDRGAAAAGPKHPPAHGSASSPPRPDRSSASPAPPNAGKPAAVPQPTKRLPSTRASSARTHVILCHRTGSESNPYVVINVSAAAWLHGHSTHPSLNGHSDIVLKQGAEPGEKLPASACVDRGRGSTSDPTETTSRTATATAGTTAGTTTATADVASERASPAGVVGETRDPQARRRSASGDPGAAARFSHTAVRGTLPFTGLPLWIALLVATALIGSGLVLRRGPMLQVRSRRARAREAGLFWSRDER